MTAPHAMTVLPAPQTTPPERPFAAHQLAAVDLGSNSFHLVIARSRGDEVSILDRVRDQVQLARGLNRQKRLGKKARDRALRCLERFKQRLVQIAPDRVRAVGTNTLRAAADADEFLVQAEEALGHPIEVIPGPEEARLIYLGVAHSLANEPGPRLVADIGGGSTECIIGARFEPLSVHSLAVGCVGLAKQCFPGGRISREGFDAARLAAEAEFQTIERAFIDTGWQQAVGASGTIRAAETILRENKWSRKGITPGGLKKLRKAILSVEHVRDLKLKGLKSQRAPVFPAGLAILTALFDRLQVRKMTAVSGALREGVLYDLLGRIRHEDVRERTIRIFQERFRVDTAQAARVERTVLALLAHAPYDWRLDVAQDGRVLAWAARLHEVGLAVAWHHVHRHSAYLLAHANMPGFSRVDTALLAAIVGNHRRKIDLATLEGFGGAKRQRAVRLIVLLRLAVLLHRARSSEPLPPLRLEGEGLVVRLRTPARWLATHPLTGLDLACERELLRPLGVDFDVVK
jgi:exopolyphosphatase/guanosine-5'-triphosphate,3'-diphosphate pyrophosphatase